MARSNEDVNNLDLLIVDGVHTPLEINGVTIVYSYTYVCPKDVTFGFEWKFSGSAIKCSIAIEQGNIAPAIEGTADGNMVVPYGAGNLITDCANDNTYVKAYAPVVANFLRIRVTGGAGNGVDTKLERFLVNTIVNA